MDLTFAHYRNRFCMFRTYYALAVGKVKADGINMKVIELPDPPSKEQEEALDSRRRAGGESLSAEFSPAQTARRADPRSWHRVEVDDERQRRLRAAPTGR